MSETNEYLPGAQEAIQETEVEEMLPAVVSAATPLSVRDAGLSAYLSAALAKAGTLRLTPEETKILKEPFGDECFVTGAGGKDELIYIEAPYLRERMDTALGMGQWSFVQLRTWSEDYKTSKGFKAVRLYSDGALIVRGVYITQAVGDMTYYPDNPQTNYGDAYEGAQSHCLRRCLKWFGVGLQAWSKTFQKGWFERKMGSRPASQPPQATPAPKKEAPVKVATANTRSWALSELDAMEDGANRPALTGYLRALGWLPADKEVENWACRFIPITKDELEALKVGLGAFALNGAVGVPYQPHGWDPATLPTPAPKSAPKATQTPSAPVWAGFLMPIGKPQTKGKRMADVPVSELEWYWSNFSPKEQIELPDGTIVPLSPKQIEDQKALRAMLDLAGKDLEFKVKEVA